VLEVGAGNSHLSEEMYRDGITNITCTDLSPVAVKRMHTRFQEFPGMVVAEANMLNLPFEDQSFDVVIEKGAMVGNSTSLLESL
jgi:ubiquinone/menaquinone biosynthesis C-methylase UbiE